MLYDHYKDPNVKTRHANTAQISIDGKVIGELAGITVAEDGGTDGSYVVGDAKPKEHLHNRWSARGSISRFIWKQSAFDYYNIGGKGLLNLPTCDITVLDEVDNKVLYTLKACTISSRDQNVQANSRIMGNLQYLALDIIDGETGKSDIGDRRADNTEAMLPGSDVGDWFA